MENFISLIIAILLFLLGYSTGANRREQDLIVKDVKAIIRECRRLSSWDDKSELKLFSWLLETPEDMLHRCSLKKLRQIKSSINKYLVVHYDMLVV